MPETRPKDQSLLINKLTLLALVGIIACLVVLIVRQRDFMADRDQRARARAALDRSPPLEEPTVSDTATEKNPRVTGTLTPTSSRLARSFPAVSAGPSREESPSLEPARENPPPPLAPIAQLALVSSTPGFQSGDLAGTAWLRGIPSRETPIQMDATCGRLQTHAPTTRHFVVTPDGRLANVFVYVKSGLPPTRIEPPTTTPLLDQRGCFFEPYVLGVMTGQKIKFRNSDPTLHNIHAIPGSNSGNREFNLGQPIQGDVTERSFAKPDVFVKVKCDVHPWMFAYLGVMDHPYFAVTDKDGNFQLPFRLPPGSYTLAARHLKAGELTQQITVRQGEQELVSFVFEVK